MKRGVNRAGGFSLLELMLVIAIIGVLTAVVAYSVSGQGEKAKRRASMTSLSVITNALSQYNLDHSSYPPDLNALVVGKYLDATKKLKDGWDTDFFYNPQPMGEGKQFTLMSLGPDKTGGTADDIDYTMQK